MKRYNHHKDKKYNNDHGFTLVEILVAVAIVAIIVAPILRGITTSMKVNNRSDRIMNQTAVAQSVMEAVSNERLETVARQLDETNTNDLTVLPNGMYDMTNGAHKEFFIGENTSETQNAVSAGSTELTKHPSNIYYYGIKGLTYDGKTYDVKVTLDASKYYGDITTVPANAVKYKNSVGYVDLSSYDKEQDGLYTEDAATMGNLCAELAGRTVISGYNLDTSDVESRATRSIIVDIGKEFFSKENHNEEDKITVVKLKYKVEVPQKYVMDGKVYDSSNIGNRYYEDVDYELFNNKASNPADMKPLRNIYILYNPHYESTNTMDIKDNIVVNNPENIPVNVFLIKQNSVESVVLSKYEKDYKVKISLSDGAGADNNPTRIRTNIGYDLKDLVDNKLNPSKVTTQGIYERSYTGGNENAMGDAFYTSVADVTDAKNDDIHIYTTKVEVYASGAYDANFSGISPLTTLDSEHGVTVTK